MEEVAYLFSGFFFIFIFIFYMALIVGGIFLWYFIIKKAIVKGIEQSVLNKDQSQYERELYLLKLELNQLKSIIKSKESVDAGQQEVTEARKVTVEKEHIAQSEEFKELVTSEFDEEKEKEVNGGN